jgi:hypothetical protein
MRRFTASNIRASEISLGESLYKNQEQESEKDKLGLTATGFGDKELL